MCGASTFRTKRVADNVVLHPASSRSRLLRFLKAVSISRRLGRVDIITVQDPFENGLVGLLSLKKLSAVLHVQIHTDFLSPEFRKHSIVNWIRTLIAPFVLRFAVRIRVVSNRIKNSLETKNYKLKTIPTVLPIFVDVGLYKSAVSDPRLALRLRPFSTKILVVSRLEPEKNVALAIRAFLKSAPREACLLIVGEGSERSKLERLAHSSAGGDRVFFEGKREASSCYPLCDLVLVTSHYEGYGRVIIEALAAGKPVLSTDVGIAREAGAIVTEPREFANALREWFAKGPREGILQNYPYTRFNEYVRAYCDDITSCARQSLYMVSDSQNGKPV
ncbi:MAG: group 1 glycosyl transferase [Parcubacteria group bacterium GW2011_GWA2_51_10]|nr:MAG: group 1 glycosyl transferase [Parcubacteria group bacterium GW2011_GWA2_51_10]